MGKVKSKSGNPGFVQTLLAGLDKQSIWILISVPVLLTLWVYFGKQSSIPVFLAPAVRGSAPATLYEYGCAFILMFVIPALIVVTVFKKPLSEFGLGRDRSGEGVRIVLIGIPLVILAAWLGARGAEMQAEYPLAKSAVFVPCIYLIVEAGYLVYYFGWEFFFRGFMLFGLEKRFGALAAILIQMIPSALVHIGKPFDESFGAILGGVLFGLIVIRTRSIWPALVLHAILGLSTNFFVLLHLYG